MEFPRRQRWRIILRLRFEPGASGAQISLTDRMFDPCDETGEKLAAFAAVLPSPGLATASGQWQTLTLAWVADGKCTVSLDGAMATLPARAAFPDGLSYLRLRSLAAEVDQAGFLVESVRMRAK